MGAHLGIAGKRLRMLLYQKSTVWGRSVSLSTTLACQVSGVQVSWIRGNIGKVSTVD